MSLRSHKVLCSRIDECRKLCRRAKRILEEHGEVTCIRKSGARA